MRTTSVTTTYASRIIAYLGCGLLVLTAGFHGSAFPQAQTITHMKASNPFIKLFLEPVWILPSLHWLIIAGLIALLIHKEDRFRLKLAGCLGLIPLLDGLTLFIFTGPFIGGYALVLSGGLIIIGVGLIAVKRDPLKPQVK